MFLTRSLMPIIQFARTGVRACALVAAERASLAGHCAAFSNKPESVVYSGPSTVRILCMSSGTSHRPPRSRRCSWLQKHVVDSDGIKQRPRFTLQRLRTYSIRGDTLVASIGRRRVRVRLSGSTRRASPSQWSLLTTILPLFTWTRSAHHPGASHRA